MEVDIHDSRGGGRCKTTKYDLPVWQTLAAEVAEEFTSAWGVAKSYKMYMACFLVALWHLQCYCSVIFVLAEATCWQILALYDELVPLSLPVLVYADSSAHLDPADCSCHLARHWLCT